MIGPRPAERPDHRRPSVMPLARQLPGAEIEKRGVANCVSRSGGFWAFERRKWLFRTAVTGFSKVLPTTPRFCRTGPKSGLFANYVLASYSLPKSLWPHRIPSFAAFRRSLPTALSFDGMTGR